MSLLRQRLLRDLAEITAEPYPNIGLVPQGDSIKDYCLVLTPENYKPLHLTIRLNDNYPFSAPRVTPQSSVVHPNVYGSFICASILRNHDGYTPAYTLQGICIQMLSFFASDKVEQDYGGEVDLDRYRLHSFDQGDSESGSSSVQDYVCHYCRFPDHNGYGLSSDAGSTPALADATPSQMPSRRNAGLETAQTHIEGLPDELLTMICNELRLEGLTPLSEAWNRIGGPHGIVQRFNIARDRDLLCFCLKKDHKSAILGIGVHVGFVGRRRHLKSEFELISFDAFDLGHRKSVQGLAFEHWLPLPISRNHFQRVRSDIPNRLELLGKAANIPIAHPEDTIYHFMNDIIVRLSEQASANPRSSLVHVSEKAVESYFHLFHTLLCLTTERPHISQRATQVIQDFQAGQRDKEHVPNLGHLLLMVLISDVSVTRGLLVALIREAVTRNVVWMLDARGANMPQLAYMESDPISLYRLKQTFEASKTSYRLLMFFNLFRKLLDRGTNSVKQLCDQIFDAHGSPPYGAAARLANDIKALQQVNNFPDFLQAMDLESPRASHFTTFLRECVEASMTKGYSVCAISQAEALRLRQAVEPGVIINNNPPAWTHQAAPRSRSSFFPGQANKRARGSADRGRVGESSRAGRAGEAGRGGRGLGGLSY